MTAVQESPDEIEKFARALQQFCGDLRGNLSTINGGFARLGETWRDPAFARFANDFQQMTTNLEHFLREADAQIPPLQVRATKLRDIQNLR